LGEAALEGRSKKSIVPLQEGFGSTVVIRISNVAAGLSLLLLVMDSFFRVLDCVAALLHVANELPALYCELGCLGVSVQSANRKLVEVKDL
jgi:hypothetical protein